MIVTFANLDHPIEVGDRAPVVLNIQNQRLFSRVCQSLISGEEEEAIEPYTIWSDAGERLKTNHEMIIVANPFELPWNHRCLQGRLYERINRLAIENGDMILQLQHLSEKQRAVITSLTYQLEGDYCFGLEWDISNFLKTFRFGVSSSDNISILDNLIAFIDLAADMDVDETLVFINLKTFLTKNDLVPLFERAFFHQIKMLLLENQQSPLYPDIEREYVVDQHFLEYEVVRHSECSSSSQGRICSDGFGAVAF